MRGEFNFPSKDPAAAATAYAELLAARLSDARPREIQVVGSRVFVRGGAFRMVSNWNLLATVTSATIDAVPGQNEVIVRYHIQVTELVLFCVFATAAVIALGMVTGDAWPVAIAGPALVWGWVFGMNCAITHSRMTSEFRRVAAQVVDHEPSVG